jgi:hypothetical protein
MPPTTHLGQPAPAPLSPACRFLQPGLLLKGVNLLYEEGLAPSGQPRKSWLMRTWQSREAVAEGLAEWQANPYYVAGRVTVPALADTFACQCFFNRWVRGGAWIWAGRRGGPAGERVHAGPLPQGHPSRTLSVLSYSAPPPDTGGRASPP